MKKVSTNQTESSRIEQRSIIKIWVRNAKYEKYLGGRVFVNGLRDLCSIPGRVMPKTLKMVLDTYLLNTQQYKVHIKGKVEQSRESRSALPDTSV